jgi:hypothetical protein
MKRQALQTGGLRLEKRCQELLKHGMLHRLCQVMVETGFQCPLLVPFLSAAGPGDDGHLVIDKLLPRSLGSLIAVQLR